MVELQQQLNNLAVVDTFYLKQLNKNVLVGVQLSLLKKTVFVCVRDDVKYPVNCRFYIIMF